MDNMYPSHYKDQPAMTLESPVLRAQFLPHIGSKMCSLIYKPLARELLVQTIGERYRLQPYDGDYVAGECSGFDEMFPSIDACFYETYPWQGTRIPDHGEVWSLRWEHRLEDQKLYFGTYGVRFPYKLEKWASLASDSILRLDYKLTNLSPFDFDFLWSAHTMINLEEDTELLLPRDVERIVSVFSLNGALGSYGDEFPWSVITQPDGQQRDLTRLRPQSAKNAEKYYVKGKLSAGWCALKYHRSQFALALSFPVETVPYLAILPNEGGWRDLYNIFIEPATATFDRPDIARLHKQVATVKAHSTYRWHLNITLADHVDFNQVDEGGRVV
jgi:hypothetical protein